MVPTVLVVMGVSGSGKSTVGTLLARHLGWPYVDGDGFHSADNVAKMAAGIPLTDDDRKPWLAAVRDWIAEQLRSGGSGVVGCSALKRAYRDALRSAASVSYSGEVRFVFLDAGRETLHRRLRARHGHFMTDRMLTSQLSTLEIPAPDEHAIAVRISDDVSPEDAVDLILAALDANER
jgi:gluconokinase